MPAVGRAELGLLGAAEALRYNELEPGCIAGKPWLIIGWR
jgi:hypothetical protein